MKKYDLTLTISEELPVWPGDPGTVIQLTSSLSLGDPANVTRLEMGAHTGTHIDAPLHFEPDGEGVEQLSLDILIGPCRVFDLTAVDESISSLELRGLKLKGVTRVLFKTRNSRWWKKGEKGEREFQKKYIHLSEDGAAFLVDAGVKLVGVDYLSVERFDSPDHSTHHLLLRNHVIIVEGINLNEVSAGDYELIALPMKIKDCEGSPARVVLIGKN